MILINVPCLSTCPGETPLAPLAPPPPLPRVSPPRIKIKHQGQESSRIDVKHQGQVSAVCVSVSEATVCLLVHMCIGVRGYSVLTSTYVRLHITEYINKLL